MSRSTQTPSLARRVLQAGDVIWFDRKQHRVVTLGARVVMLEELGGKRTRLSIQLADLLSADDFSMDIGGIRSDAAPEAAGEPIPDGVPPAALKAAERLLKDVLETLTGFKSGNELESLPGEPQAQFDIKKTNLTERVESKGKQLGCGTAKLWRHIGDYKDRGLLGLVDGRAVRTAHRSVPQVLTDAITQEIQKVTQGTNITDKAFFGRVRANLMTKTLPADFVMPSESTLRRIVLARADGRLLKSPAKTRRNASNRPKKAYTRFHAVRPGEIVLIDSTPMDVFALDPTTHEWISVQLTIAIDLFSRSVVAWRFARETKAVDASLLLADMIRPKRSREFFGDSQAKPFVGVPETIIAHIDATDDPDVEAQLIPIPFLHPESLLIDQGKVFLSETFMAACRHLGVNLLLARPYTPTDKAHVERMFRTIREGFFVHLLGYKGPDVASRGKDVEDEAYHYVHELDDLFAQWVANYWQERAHNGLFLPQVPTVELTPNEMLEEGIARAGFMHVPVDSHLYFELLPVVWRKINHYGVEAGGLLYDSEDLDPFRNDASMYTEPVAGKWPFRQDPRDKSVLHFWNPDIKTWQDISWTGAGALRQPFDDRTLTYAKELAVKRGGKRANREAVEQELSELIEKMRSVSAESKAERRLLAKSIHNAHLVERDRRIASEPKLPMLQGVPETNPEDGQTAPVERDAFALFDVVRNGGAESRFMKRSSDDAEGQNTIKSVDEAAEDDDDDLDF